MPVAGDHALLGDLPPAAVDAVLAAAGPDADPPLVMVELRHLGGALSRPSPDAGALATLDGSFLLHAAGIVPTRDLEPTVHAAAADVVSALRPWHTGRCYVNFAESRPADPRRLFPAGVHMRLTAVKAAVDPEDMFLANHPIGPAPMSVR